MKQKIFFLLTLFIFFWGFSYLYGDIYLDFYHQEQQKKELTLWQTSWKDWFSFDNITNLSVVPEIFSTPNLDFLDQLVEEIDTAKQKVWVEIYIFTEKRLRDALLRAHARWVDVRVLLENNPYMTPYINDKHYGVFEKNKISVRWSDPLNYSLNHSKILFIDWYVYVATGNFSYSAFSKNRDFFIKISDPELSQSLSEIFLADFSHTLYNTSSPAIVLSPYNSRQKLESLVQSAEKSLDIYFPYIADTGLYDILLNQVQSWVQTRIIFWKNVENDNPELVEKLKKAGAKIFFLEKPVLHAKAILVDSDILYVGSINFSRFSMDENREVGLLLRDPKTIEDFLQIFKNDISKFIAQ